MKKVSLNNKKKNYYFFLFIFFYTKFSHFWHKTQTIMDLNHFQLLAGGFVKQQFCLPSKSWLNVDFVGFLSQRAGLSLPQTEAGNILPNCVCLRSCCFLHCCSSLHSLLRRVLCHRQLSSQGKHYHRFVFLLPSTVLHSDFFFLFLLCLLQHFSFSLYFSPVCSAHCCSWTMSLQFHVSGTRLCPSFHSKFTLFHCNALTVSSEGSPVFFISFPFTAF